MTDRDLLNLEHGAEQAIDTAFTHLRKATAQQVQAAESIPSALDEAMETLDSLGGTRRCETEEDMAALLQAINDCALHAQNLTGTGGPQHRYIKEACFELGQAARFLYYFRPEIEYAGSVSRQVCNSPLSHRGLRLGF